MGSQPQYTWKQQWKREWFPDKETCLNHCEQHKSEGDVYLYKRVLIPDGFPFLTHKYHGFRWKEFSKARPNRLFGHSPWFQTLRGCLCHFKKMLQEKKEFGWTDDCETIHYLEMRRLLRDRKRWRRRHRERHIKTD
jgi:hypothetical protein